MIRLSTMIFMAVSACVNVAGLISHPTKSTRDRKADKSRMEAAQLKRERKMKRRAA